MYQSFVSYGPGPTKLVTPANIPDSRTPQVRNPNAPQAGETNLGSNTITLIGQHAIFYGPAVIVPTTPSQVRALGAKRLTGDNKTFILDTGSVAKDFVVFIPNGLTLQNVTDLDSLNANLTNVYVGVDFINLDAGGNSIPGKLYKLSAAVPYSESKRHQITIA